MPRKGHKTASRQAQLQKRRKHSESRAQEFDAGPSEADIVARQDALAEQGLDTRPSGDALPTPALAPRLRNRASASAAPIYPSIRPELTRIGVLAGIMGVILAILTVFLR
ncbi:MAG: hypothetical protein O3A47_07360 [Chloroflexi bacterium]|nr:hypothetical protein [Chloroflexota bacterium]